MIEQLINCVYAVKVEIVEQKVSKPNRLSLKAITRLVEYTVFDILAFYESLDCDALDQILRSTITPRDSGELAQLRSGQPISNSTQSSRRFPAILSRFFFSLLKFIYLTKSASSNEHKSVVLDRAKYPALWLIRLAFQGFLIYRSKDLELDLITIDEAWRETLFNKLVANGIGKQFALFFTKMLPVSLFEWSILWEPRCYGETTIFVHTGGIHYDDGYKLEALFNRSRNSTIFGILHGANYFLVQDMPLRNYENTFNDTTIGWPGLMCSISPSSVIPWLWVQHNQILSILSAIRLKPGRPLLHFTYLLNDADARYGNGAARESRGISISCAKAYARAGVGDSVSVRALVSDSDVERAWCCAGAMSLSREHYLISLSRAEIVVVDLMASSWARCVLFKKPVVFLNLGNTSAYKRNTGYGWLWETLKANKLLFEDIESFTAELYLIKANGWRLRCSQMRALAAVRKQMFGETNNLISDAWGYLNVG